jgi:Fur family ferric uptake transcriptional regulator
MPDRRLNEEIELFHSFLRQNGLKKTYQKDLILETFLCTEGHLSVEDVYALVKRRDKRVGIVTVFRTLKSLTACGISREITLGDGLTRFEHSYHHPHHHHIVCTQCHKAIEFVSPELERIQSEIVAKYRFQPANHRFQIFGLCEDCREKRSIVEPHKHDTEKIFARDAMKMALCMERRGIDFYRVAAERNHDPLGREIFERIAREDEEHVCELENELEALCRQERGLDRAPIFLHFDPCELERLIPDLREYETGGELQMDTRRSLELVLGLKQKAANFFKQYADKFLETEGKRIFHRFADEEARHIGLISSRLDAMMVPS